MRPEIKLKPNHTIVFIGDSITDADRDHPAYGPFGFGYMHFVANLLLAKYPDLNLNIINAGVGGNTIGDLKYRWQKDCIARKPHVLSVLIGINDVWRQYGEADGLAAGACADEYELTYRQLLSLAREQCKCQIVLMEPFMFSKDRENLMFRGLRAYVKVVRKLAVELGSVLVPLQRKIDELIGRVTPEKWSSDSVHPYVWAHCWIGQRWLEATGL